MHDCLIIGLTNVGKTLFALSFAEYLGLQQVDVVFTYPDGVNVRHHYGVEEAKRELVGDEPHKTRSLVTLTLDLRIGKAVKKIRLSDSSGLADRIHERPEVRQAMAQTLREIRHADMIIHVLDAAKIGGDGPDGIAEVDRQLATYAKLRGGYLMVANKMDLPHAEQGLAYIRETFPGQLVIPASALHKKGLKEVRTVVGRTV